MPPPEIRIDGKGPLKSIQFVLLLMTAVKSLCRHKLSLIIYLSGKRMCFRVAIRDTHCLFSYDTLCLNTENLLLFFVTFSDLLFSFVTVLTIEVAFLCCAFCVYVDIFEHRWQENINVMIIVHKKH